MKTNWNCIVLFVSIVVFVSCNKSTNKEERVYNGIDIQILNIVDSLDINLFDSCRNEKTPFITIEFTWCDDSTHIVRIIGGVPIPPPPMPPAPNRKVLISEMEDFVGYKKYGDIYLVFLNYFQQAHFNKFVCVDSLNFDDEPFERFNVYEGQRGICDYPTPKQRYFINEKDGLVFYDGKCLFDID
ncbi:hypothetical protein AGMMS49965_23750 [Bacteroidia bacterium]|nr:hypothetical protein AGMMS49965_23750 [Bacteroidia bacterium]